MVLMGLTDMSVVCRSTRKKKEYLNLHGFFLDDRLTSWPVEYQSFLIFIYFLSSKSFSSATIMCGNEIRKLVICMCIGVVLRII